MYRIFGAAVLLLLSLSSAQEIWPQPMPNVTIAKTENNFPDFFTAYKAHCGDIKALAEKYAKIVKDAGNFDNILASDASFGGVNVLDQMTRLAAECKVALEDLKLFNIYVDIVAPSPDKEEDGKTESRKSGAMGVYQSSDEKHTPVLISSELTQMPFEDSRKAYVNALFGDVHFTTVLGYFGCITLQTKAFSVARVVGRADMKAINDAWTAASQLTGVFLFSLFDGASYDAVKASLIGKVKGVAPSVVRSGAFFALIGPKRGQAVIVGSGLQDYERTFTKEAWLLVQTTYEVKKEGVEGYNKAADGGVSLTAFKSIDEIGAQDVAIGDNAKKMFYHYPVRTERTISIVQTGVIAEIEHCQSKVNSRREISQCTDALPLFDPVYFSVSLVIILLVLSAGTYGIIFSRKYERSMPSDYQALLDRSGE